MNTGMREKDGHKERGGTATLLAQGGLVCVGLVTERRQERRGEKLGPAVGLKGSRFGCRCYMIQAAAYLIIVNIVGRGGGESKRDQHQPQCRLRGAPGIRHVSIGRKEHPVHKQGNTPLHSTARSQSFRFIRRVRVMIRPGPRTRSFGRRLGRFMNVWFTTGPRNGTRPERCLVNARTRLA